MSDYGPEALTEILVFQGVVVIVHFLPDILQEIVVFVLACHSNGLASTGPDTCTTSYWRFYQQSLVPACTHACAEQMASRSELKRKPKPVTGMIALCTVREICSDGVHAFL